MNPLLTQTQQAVLAKVNPPQLRPVVEKVVAAGEKFLYSPETQKLIVSQMTGEGDLAENVGNGAAKLMAILQSQSKGTIPVQALIPAGSILMCVGLDFLEQAGEVQVTPDILAACTKEYSSAILQVLGVSPEKIQQYMQGQGGTQPEAAAPEVSAPAAPAGGSIMARVKGASA